jgi:hypothetical protein
VVLTQSRGHCADGALAGCLPGNGLSSQALPDGMRGSRSVIEVGPQPVRKYPPFCTAVRLA